VRLQMASDSEGLRQFYAPVRIVKMNLVANGFRFGRVTTFPGEPEHTQQLLQMASDSEGLRQTMRHLVKNNSSRCKWLPIRRGYDKNSLHHHIYLLFLLQMASDSEGLRQKVLL